MKKETEEKLAASLTAETTELLPFLPYLFQDFWALGMDPLAVTELIQKHVDLSEGTRILDLACGKGAVSVKLAKVLGVQVKGIDIIPEFIKDAAAKAQEFKVDNLCTFLVEDINEAVEKERAYDCVVFGAVGNVLGDHAETLNKLKAVVKQGGFLLVDNYDFITENQWTELFRETGLTLVEAAFDEGRMHSDQDTSFQLIADSDLGMAAITRRVNELIEKHPHKKAIFEGYINSQRSEYDEIEHQDSLVNVTWILQKP